MALGLRGGSERYGYAVAGDMKKLEEIENTLLSEGEYKDSTGAEYKIEHFGHMLQTMMMLKDVAGSKDKVATTYITAEYDAVTSGFAHKLLQLPILGEGLEKTSDILQSKSEMEQVHLHYLQSQYQYSLAYFQLQWMLKK